MAIDVSQWPTGADLLGFNTTELTEFVNNGTSEWNVVWSPVHESLGIKSLDGWQGFLGNNPGLASDSRALRPAERFTYTPGFGVSDIHFMSYVYVVRWSAVGDGGQYGTEGNLQVETMRRPL